MNFRLCVFLYRNLRCFLPTFRSFRNLAFGLKPIETPCNRPYGINAVAIYRKKAFFAIWIFSIIVLGAKAPSALHGFTSFVLYKGTTRYYSQFNKRTTYFTDWCIYRVIYNDVKFTNLMVGEKNLVFLFIKSWRIKKTLY